MATAQEVIETSLRYVGQSTNFKTSSKDNFIFGLRKLNELLAIYRKQGLFINSDAGDIPSLITVLNLPSWSIPAIEDNLGVMIWGRFNIGEPLPSWLKVQASESESDLFTLGGVGISSVFPSTLPTGSGNWWSDSGSYGGDFYPDCDPPIYTCNEDELLNASGAPLLVKGD